jgi:hypothetical protein
MVYVETWNDPDLISPEQAAELDRALRADLTALTEMGSEPESEAG